MNRNKNEPKNCLTKKKSEAKTNRKKAKGSEKSKRNEKELKNYELRK
jgi:hypothetical protein